MDSATTLDEREVEVSKLCDLAIDRKDQLIKSLTCQKVYSRDKIFPIRT